MYGLINQSFRGLILAGHGADTWLRICSMANAPSDFVPMGQYPDEMTLRLLDAASLELQQTPEQLLESFGRFWVVNTARNHYAELLDTIGTSLVSALENLDTMHARVSLSFPDLRPPSFRCTDVTARGLRLHYYSSRNGLTPMVFGLVKGLGEMFGAPLTITLVEAKGSVLDHDVFEIEWQ